VSVRLWLLCCIPLVGCGPEVVRQDRTSGLEMEYFWTSADLGRAAYYEVARDGLFRSGGGALARDRGTSFQYALSDEEVRAFVSLLKATGFRDRPDASGTDGERYELYVRERGSTTRCELRGPDASFDALRTWCAGIALRQYRDVIDAQPEAGPRAK
jgi:hypothetical protein